MAPPSVLVGDRYRFPARTLLCLDLLILFNVDVVIGLEDADFVFGEFDAIDHGEVVSHLSWSR